MVELSVQTISPLERIQQYYRRIDKATYIENEKCVVRPEQMQEAMTIFSPDTVYDRQNFLTKDLLDSFAGKERIEVFFNNHRPLAGTHDINDIRTKKGIAPNIYNRFKQYFSGIDPLCTTVTVVGKFNGVCIDHFRPAKVKLPFRDYWVVCGDQIIYRNSQIQEDFRNTTRPFLTEALSR